MLDFFTSCFSSQNLRNIQNLQLHQLLRKTFPEFFKSDYDVINDNDYVTNWRDWDVQVSSCASLDVSCLFSLDVRSLPESETINGKNYIAQVLSYKCKVYSSFKQNKSHILFAN